MCYLKPLKVIKIKGNIATLENNIKAIHDNNIGKIKIGDRVLVYGNLIVEIIKKNEKQSN